MKCFYNVGEIMEIFGFDDQYYCKFMLKVVGPKAPANTFVFPDIDDFSMVDKNMIKWKLNPHVVQF